MPEKNIDALLPAEMAHKAEEVGVLKAKMGISKTLILAVLAGSFIAFGAVFSSTVTAGSTMSFGVTKLLGGLTFSLGLVLVIIGGAELFTGNNLIVMAWANRKVKTTQLLRNWVLVYAGNMFGAIFIAVLMFFTLQYKSGGGAVALNILNIAKSKCEIGFIQGVSSGILCNILVCLAVWLCYSARSIPGKILSIIFPISAFVAVGFEHCIANMYFIPMAIMLKHLGGAELWDMIHSSPENYASVNLEGFLYHNLLPVTIGNIIGGAVLVGMVYWFVFLRKSKTQHHS